MTTAMRANEEGTAMIELNEVSYQYPDAGKLALDKISLTIPDGGMIAICGHNGSGKSTLAKLLNALLLPDSGTVSVDGMDTRDESQTLAIRQRVGMVFQNPDNQLVTTIVEEDVGFGPENLGVPPKEILQRVERALSEVNMLAYAKSASHALSGGQKQRIAIAGMLAMQPEILVLDEATAMLDPGGRAEVLATVRRLNRERDITIVMITQYMEETVDCDRVFVLSGGMLALEGTPREVFYQRKKLCECGLDVPVYVQMRDTLVDAGMPIAGEPLRCEELSAAIAAALQPGGDA